MPGVGATLPVPASVPDNTWITLITTGALAAVARTLSVTTNE